MNTNNSEGNQNGNQSDANPLEVRKPKRGAKIKYPERRIIIVRLLLEDVLKPKEEKRTDCDIAKIAGCLPGTVRWMRCSPARAGSKPTENDEQRLLEMLKEANEALSQQKSISKPSNTDPGHIDDISKQPAPSKVTSYRYKSVWDSRIVVPGVPRTLRQIYLEHDFNVKKAYGGYFGLLDMWKEKEKITDDDRPLIGHPDFDHLLRTRLDPVKKEFVKERQERIRTGIDRARNLRVVDKTTEPNIGRLAQVKTKDRWWPEPTTEKEENVKLLYHWLCCMSTRQLMEDVHRSYPRVNARINGMQKRVKNSFELYWELRPQWGPFWSMDATSITVKKAVPNPDTGALEYRFVQESVIAMTDFFTGDPIHYKRISSEHCYEDVKQFLEEIVDNMDVEPLSIEVDFNPVFEKAILDVYKTPLARGCQVHAVAYLQVIVPLYENYTDKRKPDDIEQRQKFYDLVQTLFSRAHSCESYDFWMTHLVKEVFADEKLKCCSWISEAMAFLHRASDLLKANYKLADSLKRYYASKGMKPPKDTNVSEQCFSQNIKARFSRCRGIKSDELADSIVNTIFGFHRLKRYADSDRGYKNMCTLEIAQAKLPPLHWFDILFKPKKKVTRKRKKAQPDSTITGDDTSEDASDNISDYTGDNNAVSN
ncbi:MAG: hypothetical protein JRN52_06520 [Nitrososphaerota archaeon]|nr:hypothetical protein [Nitrososphaerota archaeon]